jgi:AGZA family xanthine/uracil permease-like MFS transporter
MAQCQAEAPVTGQEGDDSMATRRAGQAPESVPPGGSATALERFFRVRERGSSLGVEARAGLTTFMVMAYILAVNPAILSIVTAGKGPDFVATATMTALAAGVVSVAMGLVTNYPIALASGMGLNAFVAVEMILRHNIPWPAAMGAVVINGLIITALVLAGFREAVMLAIPLNLKRAMGVGVGLFILALGLVNAGFIRVPVESIEIRDGRAVGQPQPALTLGNLTDWPAAIAVFALVLTLVLLARNVRGGLALGILGTTVLGLGVHAAIGVDISSVPGVQGALPTQLAPISFATFGAGLNFGVFAAVPILTAVLLVFTLLLSDFFDTMGTVVGLGTDAGWLDEEGRLPGIRRILLVDGLGAVFGGIASASSVTSYIESAAGIADGARTGLAVVVTGLLFLLAILLAPFLVLVPAEATAPALIVVGFYMARVLREIDFSTLEEGLPAFLTVAVMPFTFSIAAGLGAGFVVWVLLKLVTGQYRRVPPLMYGAAFVFVLYFGTGALQNWLG